MKPECPPLRISLKIKSADGGSWREVESIYEEIPRRFSKKKFLTKGVFSSGLSPSFHTECLPSLLGRSFLNKKEIQGLSSQLIPFSFPRPGIENRRRIAYLLNPLPQYRQLLFLINIGKNIEINWRKRKIAYLRLRYQFLIKKILDT